jgi:transcriptional regulator with XRE-family HTH domain
MTEGLAAQISSIVRQHLADAHRMLGALLAQLDAADPTRTSVPPPANEIGTSPTLATPTPPVKAADPPRPAIAELSTRPETVARRLRKARQRQRARQAANGAAAASVPAPATGEKVSRPWPELRAVFHAAIKARHLTRDQAAAALDVSKGSICGWLVPSSGPPSAANIATIRAWLDQPPSQPPAVVKAAGGGADDHHVDDHDWPSVREKLKVVIRDRSLTHAEIGRALDVQANTVAGYLAKSHEHRSPGDRVTARIATWLAEGAAVPPLAAEGPPFVLAPAERDRLAAYLSIAGNSLELRETFGCTRELLDQAASGEHLHAEVISRVRGVLANGVAAE